MMYYSMKVVNNIDGELLPVVQSDAAIEAILGKETFEDSYFPDSISQLEFEFVDAQNPHLSVEEKTVPDIVQWISPSPNDSLGLSFVVSQKFYELLEGENHPGIKFFPLEKSRERKFYLMQVLRTEGLGLIDFKKSVFVGWKDIFKEKKIGDEHFKFSGPLEMLSKKLTRGRIGFEIAYLKPAEKKPTFFYLGSLFSPITIIIEEKVINRLKENTIVGARFQELPTTLRMTKEA